jgi:1-acyl-sn-glycerol-3-phosphate acyltransferase
MAQLGLDYPTKWGRGYTARFVRSLFQSYFLSPVTRRMSSLEVRGIENITGRGPFIFVANHTSNLDTPLVLTALPKSERKRTVVAAALDTFFMDSRRAFQTVLFYNGIPIERHKVNRRSAQQALELIQDHWNLLIYPEGGRSPDGVLQEFKGGAAYLADRSKATVIPTYIHESGLLRGPKYAKAPQFVEAPSKRRHHVIVAFGPALHCEEDENIRRFGVRIKESVEQLGREVSGDVTFGVKRPSDD